MSLKVAILGSGKGSNAKAIMEAEKANLLGNAKIVVVISDRKNARILDLANKFKKPNFYIGNELPSKKIKEQEYIKILKKHNVELIVLAGFMRIISTSFIGAFRYKIINLHPSLLPKYPGLNSIKKALNAKEKVTGCTIHWVNSELDSGPIIEQRYVKISKNDTLDSLSEKVHTAEHLLLPKVITEISLGGIPFPEY